jgi:hypothetical protein
MHYRHPQDHVAFYRTWGEDASAAVDSDFALPAASGGGVQRLRRTMCVADTPGAALLTTLERSNAETEVVVQKGTRRVGLFCFCLFVFCVCFLCCVLFCCAVCCYMHHAYMPRFSLDISIHSFSFVFAAPGQLVLLFVEHAIVLFIHTSFLVSRTWAVAPALPTPALSALVCCAFVVHAY